MARWGPRSEESIRSSLTALRIETLVGGVLGDVFSFVRGCASGRHGVRMALWASSIGLRVCTNPDRGFPGHRDGHPRSVGIVIIVPSRLLGGSAPLSSTTRKPIAVPVTQTHEPLPGFVAATLRRTAMRTRGRLGQPLTACSHSFHRRLRVKLPFRPANGHPGNCARRVRQNRRAAVRRPTAGRPSLRMPRTSVYARSGAGGVELAGLPDRPDVAAPRGRPGGGPR